MGKKKHPKEEPKTVQPSLHDLSTRDLLKSIRQDLAEKAKQAGLAGSETPPKPPKSR